MSEFRVSEQATQDLKEIWLYIAESNPDAADRFVRALTSRFPMLAGQAEMGRLRRKLSNDLRSHAVGNHIIFYRRSKNRIEIVRVLHGARDLPPLFE